MYLYKSIRCQFKLNYFNSFITVQYKILDGDNFDKFGELQKIAKILLYKFFFLKTEVAIRCTASLLNSASNSM